MPEAILLRRRYAIAEKIKSMNKLSLFMLNNYELRQFPKTDGNLKTQIKYNFHNYEL
ncbi:hypothetical protein GS682_07240 [Nostoc sp. B(2019)]|nr:hypothetical protein [Nostoc sp. B(2019)]